MLSKVINYPNITQEVPYKVHNFSSFKCNYKIYLHPTNTHSYL